MFVPEPDEGAQDFLEFVGRASCATTASLKLPLLGVESPPRSPSLTPTLSDTCSENALLSCERPAVMIHLVMISTLANGSKLKAPLTPD